MSYFSTRDDRLKRLEQVIRQEYPNCALIPSSHEKGKEKAPLFVHKDVPLSDLWRQWDDYLREMKKRKQKMAGVLLLIRGDMVVVDVDDRDTVSKLEMMFPQTLVTVSQKTSKGMHYFFRRTPLCDALGLFDSSGDVKNPITKQKYPIDIKTVCKNRTTGGVLSVCPSGSKSWVRPLYEMDVQMQNIPDDMVHWIVSHKSSNAGKQMSKMNDNKDDYVVKLMMLLSKTRWDDRNQWRNIAIALKNDFGDKYKQDWFTLSRLSSKFSSDDAEKLWSTVCPVKCRSNENNGDLLTIKSLHMWAKQDDPIGYRTLTASRGPPVSVNKNWREGDRGLAYIAYELLKGTIKQTSENEYFYYVGKERLWKRGSEKKIWRMVSEHVESALIELESYLSFDYDAKKSDLAEDEVVHAAQTLDRTKQEIRKVVKYVRGYTGMRHVSSIAGPLFEAPEFEQRLDSKPFLLGVQNGVVDLHTGTLRERRDDDCIYRLIPIDYDPDADSSFMQSTVHQIMAEDDEMTEFLQKLLGYAITGEVSEEIFPVFTAGERNGKGVLMQLLSTVMGDFFRDMNKGLIVEHRMSNGDAERAKLLGSRIAVFNELAEGEKLLASEVQILSGGDGIPAKQLYKNPITIQPRHLCILATNHMPELNEVIPALMERMLCIPFPVTFRDLEPEEMPTRFLRQRRNDLKEALRNNISGVLKWLVEGARKWYETRDLKRNAPQKVKAFSRAYFFEQDRLAAFIQHRCERHESFKVSSSQFLNELNDWLAADGHRKMSAKSICAQMKAKGISKEQKWVDGKNVMSFVGIRIKYDVDAS